MAESKRKKQKKKSKAEKEAPGKEPESEDEPSSVEVEPLETSESETEAEEEPDIEENAEAAENEQEQEIEPGSRLNIDEPVYVEIAHRETTDIQGIIKVRGGAMENVFKKRSGIRLDTMNSEHLQLSLHLHVEYGPHLPSLAEKVRDRVSRAIWHMTGRVVDRIDIHIDHIVIASQQPEQPMETVLPEETEEDEEIIEEGNIDF